MDGTLVDTEEYWIKAEMDLVAEFGGAWSHSDGLSVVGKPIPVTAVELQTRGGVQLETTEIVNRLIDAVESQMQSSGIPWRPGAYELLEQVWQAGIRSALVTMSYTKLAAALTNTLPAGMIELAVTGDMVKNGKPHPEPYLMAAEMLGVDIRTCVAIEDSLTGLQAAESSGAHALGVPHMVEIPAAPNRNRANSLTEIGWQELHLIMQPEVFDIVQS